MNYRRDAKNNSAAVGLSTNLKPTAALLFFRSLNLMPSRYLETVSGSL